MEEYPALFKYLKFKKRRDVAKQITKAVVKGSIQINDESIIKELLVFINPVLEKEPDYENVSDAIFKEEQMQVAKIVFQIQNTDAYVVWEILRKFLEKFEKGG
jgi:hypothetical protein